MSGKELFFTARAGDCTLELQATIDTCADSSILLRLGSGVHHCGALRLKSGLRLHFEDGAILRMQEGYDTYQGNVVGVVAEESNLGMIVAIGQKNIQISGRGVIEGQGESYIAGELEDMGTHLPAALRPRTLVIEKCENVSLADFTIKHSPMWTIHLIRSKHVKLEKLRVDNDRKMPNTDGVAVDACEDVVISRCHITTADDGVVLKTSCDETLEPIGVCRSVRVSDCHVESESCAIKLGTESYGDFVDISFSDCRIANSNRAIGLFSRDGGAMRNISFQRISLECHETPEGFWGSGEAITINCADRRASRRAGAVSNILFEDVSGVMEGAINLVADSLAGVRDVTLRRVVLTQQKGAINGAKYDMRPTRFDLAPSADTAGRANAWVKDDAGNVIGLVAYPGGQPGLFASNVSGLVLEEVRIDRLSNPLPQNWNAEAIVILQDEPVCWS